MRLTNENEEAYIKTTVGIIMENIDWHTADWLKDGAEVEWSEIEKILFYHIRESYLIGRVAKGMEMADKQPGWLIDEILEENRVATEEAPQ